MLRFSFEKHTWEELTPVKESPEPIPRAGHSAVIREGKMYVFGGKDDDNEKLKDFWCFDLESRIWTQLDCSEASIASRSGHSASIYKDSMIIFGGIHEVTKELDDMAVYDFKKGEWNHLFKEYVAPVA